MPVSGLELTSTFFILQWCLLWVSLLLLNLLSALVQPSFHFSPLLPHQNILRWLAWKGLGKGFSSIQPDGSDVQPLHSSKARQCRKYSLPRDAVLGHLSRGIQSSLKRRIYKSGEYEPFVQSHICTWMDTKWMDLLNSSSWRDRLHFYFKLAFQYLCPLYVLHHGSFGHHPTGNRDSFCTLILCK